MSLRCHQFFEKACVWGRAKLLADRVRAHRSDRQRPDGNLARSIVKSLHGTGMQPKAILLACFGSLGELMTERLYYHDSYLRQFEARIVKSEQTAQGCEVVLDATAFYPTSGGQPHDLGTMSGARIQEVVERDDEIVHCLTGSFAGERLRCEIDWARRFDHMQQHTGQHVLSQAFVRAAKRNTVGFHMGADYVTIDLDAEGISPQQISAAEHLANEIIYENRPIAVRIVPEAEVPALGLRKESQRIGPLRVVSVEDFDVSACGGTHVRRTGEIGSIVIRKVERVNRQARVEFVCGRRSVVSGQRDLETLSTVARQLSVGLNEVPCSGRETDSGEPSVAQDSSGKE